MIRIICISILSLSIMSGCNSGKETGTGLDPIPVEGGLISGIWDRERDLFLYAGIPYAAPPVGELRWKEPQPVIPWKGVRPADRFSSICYQPVFPQDSWITKEFYSEGVPDMSEDCLYLNIWAPAEKEKNACPVMLWFHGGGLQHGWGHEMEFDGEAFVKRGVILITINYRVGVFGFLAHPWLTAESAHRSSGNYGTLDQIAALKWVRNNIAQFGGDPDNITLMGQSAGARSTMALISSPLSKGEFKQAIIQSGSGAGYKSINPVVALQEREQIGVEFVEYAGVKNVEDLRSIEGATLLNYYVQFNAEREATSTPTLRFTPNVDGYVLLEDHDSLLEKGEQALVPAIIGYTSEDMTPEALKESAVQWSLEREKQGQPSTYLYLFKRQLPGDSRGAFHSSELWYVFGTLDRCWRPFTEEDHRLSAEMITYWTNFARKGDPNEEGVPYWERYSDQNSFIKEFDIQ